jgi:hypothetical protein
MVQLLSLSVFVLQPQASQVHRSAEPDADDSPPPPPSDGDDDSPLLLAGLSIFEKVTNVEAMDYFVRISWAFSVVGAVLMCCFAVS